MTNTASSTQELLLKFLTTLESHNEKRRTNFGTEGIPYKTQSTSSLSFRRFGSGEGWNGPFFLALSLDTPKLTLLTEESSPRHEELKSKSRPLSRGNIVKRKAKLFFWFHIFLFVSSKVTKHLIADMQS